MTIQELHALLEECINKGLGSEKVVMSFDMQLTPIVSAEFEADDDMNGDFVIRDF